MIRYFHHARHGRVLSRAARVILLSTLSWLTVRYISFSQPRSLFSLTSHGAQDACDVDWSQVAYVQYVTKPNYLCNAVMMFERLHVLGSKADRVMLYPSGYHLGRYGRKNSHTSVLLRKARDEFRVKLQPIELQIKESSHRKTSSCFFLEHGMSSLH